jgi:hypothetical protein
LKDRIKLGQTEKFGYEDINFLEEEKKTTKLRMVSINQKNI